MTGRNHEQRSPRKLPERIAATGCALCDEVAARILVEEPVHPRDVEACRIHQETCARCRALDALGPDLLGEPEPADEKKLDAVWHAMDQQIHPTHHRKIALPVAIAAALAVIGIAWILASLNRKDAAQNRSRKQAPRLQTTTLTLASGCLLPEAQGQCMETNHALSQGAVVTSASDQVLLKRGRDLVVAALNKTTFSIQSKRDAVAIRLLTGTLAVRLTPGRNLSVALRTDRATVRVKGTMFSVRRDARDTLVAVSAGRVEVTFGPDHTRALLGPGQAFSVAHASRIEKIDAATRRLLASLAASAHRPYVLPGASAQMDQHPGKEWPPGQPREPSAASHVRRSKTTDPKPGLGRGHEPSETNRSSGIGARTRGSAPLGNLALLKKAQDCKKARNWSCALATYQALAQGKGGTALSSALVAMAQIELDALHRFAAAIRHFDAYLKRRPHGALAAEALYGKARALRALGRRNQEKRVLKRFLEQFPSAIRAGRVRRRIEVLEHRP